ncbi:tRNA (adenosine(37)-N6)-threonylcarbamoyltransferase complex transferase subunit TsaD, partial [Candidatus Woesebacteria bacterium CG_4_9_14_3_um_filter_39_10]
IIPVNHIEAHLLSPLASPSTDHRPPTTFPALGLVVSGGNTQLILIEKIGKYKILAQTVDDALGEALDKAARLLGLGYPGGAILEKIARVGNPDAYTLPSPLIDDKIKNRFSYSGLKTAMYRLIEKEKPLTKEKIYNLAASFQEVAFDHILNVLSYQINHQPLAISHFLLGGGVASNNLLRSKLRKLLRPYEITLHVPYTKKLCGDNAAMIGVCAYLKSRNAKNLNAKLKSIDREPRMKIA